VEYVSNHIYRWKKGNRDAAASYFLNDYLFVVDDDNKKGKRVDEWEQD